MRRFGYTLRGKPARSQKLLWRGDRVSAIAAISCGGVLDCNTHGTVNGDTFCHFLEYDLCPKLQLFNGVNPNSVWFLIMPQFIMSKEQQQKLRVWVLLFITFHLTPQTLTR